MPIDPHVRQMAAIRPSTFQPRSTLPLSTTRLNGHNSKKGSNFLMDDFKTADGEVIDPYKILKVGRKANKDEIRKNYRMLSKKYHPDGVRFREVFPGKWYV
jgi:DnaJ-domain-containing protein 1